MKGAPLSLISSRRSQLKQIQIFLEEVFFHAEAHSSIHFLTNSRESRIDRPPPELFVSYIDSAKGHDV